MMNIPEPRFVAAPDYYHALLRHIPKARKRVVIHAMGVSWGAVTGQLVPLLINAAQRGIEVRIVGDVYTKFYAKIPRLARSKVASWDDTNTANHALQAAGVHVTYVGKIGPNPYKGRCHSKVTLIDDLVYTFGGVNIADDSFSNHDYMLEIRDQKLADSLYALVRTIESDPKQPLEDQAEQLSANDTLLFDGGKPGKSVIYETACDVVAKAKKVYFVSQMCPSGKLAKLITATNNECYFIRLSQADPPSHIDLFWDKFRYGITNHYKGSAYIHAKFILTEGQDGSKHIISGSNNLSWRGIKYGTKEIAVHSTDRALWQAFYDFLQHHIKQAAN